MAVPQGEHVHVLPLQDIDLVGGLHGLASDVNGDDLPAQSHEGFADGARPAEQLNILFWGPVLGNGAGLGIGAPPRWPEDASDSEFTGLSVGFLLSPLWALSTLVFFCLESPALPVEAAGRLRVGAPGAAAEATTGPVSSSDGNWKSIEVIAVNTPWGLKAFFYTTVRALTWWA